MIELYNLQNTQMCESTQYFGNIIFYQPCRGGGLRWFTVKGKKMKSRMNLGLEWIVFIETENELILG